MLMTCQFAEPWLSGNAANSCVGGPEASVRAKPRYTRQAGGPPPGVPESPSPVRLALGVGPQLQPRDRAGWLDLRFSYLRTAGAI